MSTAEPPPTLPDEGEHDSDACSTDSEMTDSSSDSDRSRAALKKQQVRRPRTNLLSLPPELHYEIFKHLEHEKAGKRPICRALWPMSRRNLFRNVRLLTPERLQRFAGLLRPVHRTYRDPSLLREVRQTGRLVKVLVISAQSYKSPPQISTVSSEYPTANGSYTSIVRSHRKVSAASSHIRTILSQATHVKSLTLHGPRALEYLAPAKSGFGWLRELEQLSLENLDGPAQHWTAECLSRLRRFPQLKELHLDLPHLRDGASPPTALETTLQPVPQVLHLSLQITDLVVPVDFARCAALFSGLEELMVDLGSLAFPNIGGDDTIGVGDLLQAFPVSRLRNLVITASVFARVLAQIFRWPGLSLEADLARFNRLTRLSLCCNFFHRAGQLFDLLAEHVPQLQYLELGNEAYVRAAKLLSFVRRRGGPGRALKGIQCDIISASFGNPPVPSEMPQDPRVITGTLELAKWWRLPAWLVDFTRTQACRLIIAGHAVGVRITGTLLDAIHVERVRIREQVFLNRQKEEWEKHLYDVSSLFGSE